VESSGPFAEGHETIAYDNRKEYFELNYPACAGYTKRTEIMKIVESWESVGKKTVEHG
jgi:hypothetical protein